MTDYTLGDELLAMLSSVAGTVFTTPTWSSFLTLACGWVLCRGRRTTSGMVLAARAEGAKHFSSYHRFFSTARWSDRALRLGLVRVLLAAFCRRGELTLVGDDTVRAKTGPRIAGAAYWHNHCAAGRQQRATVGDTAT
jgi:hypothetical protein